MDNIVTELNGSTLCLAFNRPEKRNALTSAMYTAASEAIERAENDESVRVILLHGRGDTFTAGNDLEDFLSSPWTPAQVPPAVRFMEALVHAHKPVIAAVHGAAVGIGFTMLLLCDLVFAVEGTKLLAPFIDIGIVPEAGSTFLLPILIGHQRATELLMLEGALSAKKAHEWGLVNAMVRKEELFQRALAASNRLSQKPPWALLSCKELLRRPMRPALVDALSCEVRTITEQLQRPETKGIMASVLAIRKKN